MVNDGPLRCPCRYTQILELPVRRRSDNELATGFLDADDGCGTLATRFPRLTLLVGRGPTSGVALVSLCTHWARNCIFRTLTSRQGSLKPRLSDPPLFTSISTDTEGLRRDDLHTPRKQAHSLTSRLRVGTAAVLRYYGIPGTVFQARGSRFGIPGSRSSELVTCLLPQASSLRSPTYRFG